ncbi:hypothetical protein LWI29_027927 [Acer saccharum]|uniref:Uncharacterized protein n=1 Tax=Acer saccharum TaxID=4024 RepID=A0AA39RN20_ACESA|nr:hypothetical protein LWI29_027927 [Acer saccharum]
MDPSLRSSLFNRMMQAMELGDKCTTDKIESLIRNFRSDSPVPISVYVPSSEDEFIPNISPPSSNSDSPMMPRSSTPGGSKRRASRAPRESLLDAQTTVDSDVEDHQRDRLHFSLDCPCSFDTEVNVVGEEELCKYNSRFDIPDSVTLMLPGDRAVWNPPENTVAIYGAMLSCGVTLPLQPFIARFLAEARIASAPLAPNSYRILMCLCLMWKLKGYGPPTPREICHFYTLRQAGNVCDFDTVCDLQARAVKNSEAASKRHAAGLAKEGIVSPNGDDPLDGEEAANTPVATTAVTIPAAATPSRKGKEKVGASGRVSDIPDFNADVPETPHDPASDLAPRAGRGAGELALVETPSIQTDVREDLAEGTNAAVPPPEEVNELNILAATPPRTASPPMMSELAKNYKHGNKASWEIKRLREQASILAAEKLSAEESHAQQLAQLRESSDGHLSAQLTAEEKLFAIEEEIRSLKEHLSASQESFAARLEAERVAEEAREKAEHEALDLRNQLSSRELIFDNLKAMLEVEAVDHFKRSPAYDALLLREFERGMRKILCALVDQRRTSAQANFGLSAGRQALPPALVQRRTPGRLALVACAGPHQRTTSGAPLGVLRRTEPHPMHLEIPSKRAFNTYYSGQKGSFSGSGAEPDLGPVAGRDYEPFIPDGDEEVTWPSEEEIEDEEDSEGPPAAS